MLFLFPILLTSPLIALVSYVYYERYLHPLSQIPGPFFASISRLYLLYNSLKLQRNRLEIALHQKYGPIVRISPNEISVSDPKCIKQIYGASHPFLKSRWYEPIESKDPEGMNLLGEVDMDKYRHQRRLIGPCFTTDAIKRRETLLDRPLGKFVLKMNQMGEGPVDLVKWMNILALDLLTEICFAESQDYITAGDDRGNARDIDIFWKQIQWVGLVPDFWAGYLHVAELANSFGIPLPIQKSTSGLAIIQYYISQLTGRAKTGTTTTTERADLAGDIQRFAASHEEFKPQWEATTIIHIIAAGFDTLGMTLAACVAHLSQSAESQAKLHAELDGAKQNGSLDDAPTYDQASALPYLQACIAESMRLTSVIGVSLPRVVPIVGAVIEGHTLPGGTVVGINPWVVHRDKAMFGKDADEFRPERYSEATKARRFELDAHSLAFGGASRSCPGQSLARVALLKSVAAMFLHFTFQVLSEEEAVNYKAKREECFFVVKWYDVWVKLKSRGE